MNMNMNMNIKHEHEHEHINIVRCKVGNRAIELNMLFNLFNTLLVKRFVF